MADIKQAIETLGDAFSHDDPVLLTASEARIIYNLLTAHPAVLAGDLADAALVATHAAREAFWQTEGWDQYDDAHRALVRALRAVVDTGWLEVDQSD